jgi:transposase InsO family protein
MDLFSRRIVSWPTSKHIDTALISEALHKAIKDRQPDPGLLYHSDQGSQYASKGYRKTLNLLKMKCRMSRKGNCWDNVPMKRFFSSLKSEWLRDKMFPTHEFVLYNFCPLNRSALTITDTELKLIAAAANMGFSSNPINGYSIPAAIGTPRTL